MRVLWQPTQADPADWREIDSRDWSALDSSVKCHGLCVQGLICDGADQYTLRNLPGGGVRVELTYVDVDDWPPGFAWSRVITIPALGPDPSWGNAINTRHQHIIYAEDEIRPVLAAAYRGNTQVTVRPWSERMPLAAKTLLGEWVSDTHHEAHRAARRLAGWREWTEGLDPSELDANGRVLDQRKLDRWVKPTGTRTYYGSSNAGPAIQTATFNRSYTFSPTGAVQETDSAVNQNGANVFTFVGPANEPNSAAWPTIGVYRAQLDCVSIGVDLTFGMLTQGGGTGRMTRADSLGTTALQTIQQSQAAFSGSGLKLASITNPAWTAGAASDRWAGTVAGVRVVGHGNQSLTLELGELDDFTDGPWQAAAAQAFNTFLFGSPW